ncbi:MAG: four helix bundle protein [Terriglobales bacterium]
MWSKAHQFTLAAYKVTRHFPAEELYGLVTQIRRAAVSIGANLAEGCGRCSGGDFARYVQIALGSATEVSYHLLVARDLGYFSRDGYTALSSQLDEIMRMLASLHETLKRSNAPEPLRRSAAAAGTKS